MELSGNYFEYDGVASREFGLIFANVETDRLNSIAGSIEPDRMFNRQGNKSHFVRYDEAGKHMTFDAEIVTEDGGCLNSNTMRMVKQWLFYRNGFQKLYIDYVCRTDDVTTETINNETKRLYLNCIFINPQIIEGNGGVVGYKFTVECDSALAWQDAASYRYSLGNGATGTATLTLNVDSDIDGYIYPKVTIQMGSSGGDIVIVNTSDDSSRQTAFTGLSAGTTFTMNGDGVNYISGDNYSKFSKRNFIRLRSGQNTISVQGNISVITFEFQNRRYL